MRKKSIATQKTRDLMNSVILMKTPALIRAGISVALGQQFIYRIDEEKDAKGKTINRKHIQVTDPDEIENALDIMQEGGKDPDEKYYYITTKEPDTRAIDLLLNRAFGKPKEVMEVDIKVSFAESLRQLSIDANKRIDENKMIDEAKIIDVDVEEKSLNVL